MMNFESFTRLQCYYLSLLLILFINTSAASDASATTAKYHYSNERNQVSSSNNNAKQTSALDSSTYSHKIQREVTSTADANNYFANRRNPFAGHNRNQDADGVATNCVVKKNSILKQKHQAHEQKLQRLRYSSANQGLYQILKPVQSSVTKLNDTDYLPESEYYYDEYVPQCTKDGNYEEVQCHNKMGYCWCVNKAGQPIVRTSVQLPKKPDCDIAKQQVMHGINNRTRGVPKPEKPVESEEKAYVFGDDFEQSESDILAENNDRSSDGHASRGLSGRSQAGSSPKFLMPENCMASRTGARERAQIYQDESIWIPECDSSNRKLYADKQCHRSKICWCVDQVTGYPIFMSEPLAKRANMNCTEARINNPKPKFTGSSTYRSALSTPKEGFSDQCNLTNRTIFISTIMDQIREQYQSHLVINMSKTSSKDSIRLQQKIGDSEAAEWKFTHIDINLNGKLEDREWFKFKETFVIVDKIEERRMKQAASGGSQITLNNRIYIPRSQKRCWREFLKFCADGDLTSDKPIYLERWMACTEFPGAQRRFQSADRSLNEDYKVYLKLATMTKNWNKNPLLVLFKSD